MTRTPFGNFFLPGPTEVRPEVLAAMLQPMIAHRGVAFEALFERIQLGLAYALGTRRVPYVSSSSATGLMEAAIRNAPEGRVLSLVNGAFSARFADIARSCGRDVAVLEVPWGTVVEPDAARKRLVADRFAALTVVHSETSTGALTDVEAIAAIGREAGVASLVDSVSGAGGVRLEPDSWALDFVLTGSQKAFALPPGLSFGVADPAFARGAAASPGRGRYFDLVEFERYAARHQTPNTPALSLLYALDVQLAAIRREGIEARWERHDAMAARTHAWVAEASNEIGAGLEVLAAPGNRSPTVTTVVLPPSIPGEDLVRGVEERGFVIGDGYGKLRGTTVRIGHMGDHTVETLDGCLAACTDALRALVG